MSDIISRIKAFLKYKYDVYQTKKRYSKKIKSLESPIFIDGHPDSKNFGDALNIFLVEYLSKKNVFPSKFISNTKYEGEQSYSVIGSICQWSREKSIIWGSGFISDKYVKEHFTKPYKVNAVRGPLTRNIYLENNVDCPEIYGDPALLMPLIYNPKIDVKYEVGIIPHYTDIDSDWVNEQKNNPNVLFIDIMIACNYEQFVQQIKSCKKIVTSSLHGVILSHAYKIPVCHIKLSDNLTGGDFKFNDYLLSVNKIAKTPVTINSKSTPIDKLDFDSEVIKFDVKPLINACPFIKTNVKEKLLNASNYYESA